MADDFKSLPDGIGICPIQLATSLGVQHRWTGDGEGLILLKDLLSGFVKRLLYLSTFPRPTTMVPGRRKRGSKFRNLVTGIAAYVKKEKIKMHVLDNEHGTPTAFLDAYGVIIVIKKMADRVKGSVFENSRLFNDMYKHIIPLPGFDFPNGLPQFNVPVEIVSVEESSRCPSPDLANMAERTRKRKRLRVEIDTVARKRPRHQETVDVTINVCT